MYIRGVRKTMAVDWDGAGFSLRWDKQFRNVTEEEESWASPSKGVIIVNYERAGSVLTGSL